MLNKTQIIGRLGKDPDIASTQSGTCVATITVATGEKWKDKQTGEQKEKTTWHNVKAFGRLAEIIRDYLKKGSQVYIEGSSYTDEYEKDGQKRYFHYINARELKMLDNRADGQSARHSSSSDVPQPASAMEPDGFADSKIPF